MSLKLRELWNECEKMDPFTLKVFLDGLKEIAGTVDERYLKQVAKPCVVKPKATRSSSWTPAEEDLLHKYCNESDSVTKGVTRFLQETDSERTAKACEVRVDLMKREGRW